MYPCFFVGVWRRNKKQKITSFFFFHFAILSFWYFLFLFVGEEGGAWENFFVFVLLGAGCISPH